MVAGSDLTGSQVPGGTVAALARRPLTWVSWVFAALSAGYIAWTIPTAGGILAAVALPLLVLRLPVTAIAGIVIVAEEISTDGRYGWLTTLGSDAYLAPGKVPIVLPLALTAAVAAAVRWRRAESLRPGWLDVTVIGSVAALIAWTFGVGVATGQSIFSAGNQNSRPFALLGLGIVIGFSLRRLPAERRPLLVMAGVALTALLVAAAVAIPMGGTADARLSRYFIYYDSALPAIASAVLLALLADRGGWWDWRYLVPVVVTPLLVLFSFRRGVWLAAGVVLVVLIVLRWRRWRTIVWRGGVAVAVLAVVILAAPGLAADLGIRDAPPVPVAGPPAGPSVAPAAGPSSPATARPSSPATVKPSVTPFNKPSGSASPDQGGGGRAAQESGKPAPAAPAPSRKSGNQQADAQKTLRADSTEGHIQDLRLGWDYVKAHFWTGVGPVAPQLPGLAAQSALRVYVHNELLQDWLRYGPFGALLVTVLLAATVLLALRALRDPGLDSIRGTAAVFCLLTPICAMTAPFLSDTSRWPVVFGLAAGMLILPARHHDETEQP